MKSSKSNNLLFFLLVFSLFIVLFLENELANTAFLILSLSVLVLLRGVLALLRRTPDSADKRLDRELQLSILNHDLSRSTHQSNSIQVSNIIQYREPDYPSKIAETVDSQRYEENTAEYN